MILKVNRVNFLKKIKIAEKAVKENKIKPIISYIYMETINNKLWLCGTNLELTISTEMECEILQEGKAVFQHNLVEEYLKEIKDEEITLKIEKEILTITTTDGDSEFVLMDPNEFPKLNSNNLEEELFNFSIDKNELVENFERIRFASSLSTDNLSINCIRMEIMDNKLRFISTDSYRLVYLEKECDYSNAKLEISIPLNTVEALIKLLKIVEGDIISFTLQDKQLYFKIDDIEIVSRTIDLPFPNYEGILASNSYNKSLTINKLNIEKMLKRIQIFVKNNSESKYGAIFNIADEKIEIFGIGDIAKAKEENKANYIGDNLKISLNVKFILEFIQQVVGDELVFEFTTSSSAVRIREKDNDKYIYIVMPLALKE